MAPFDTRNGKKYIMVRPDITIEGDNDAEETLNRIKALPGNTPPAWDQMTRSLQAGKRTSTR